MNKIIVDGENIVLDKITKKLEVDFNKRESEFGISKLTIKVLSSCDLYLDISIDNSKYYIEIDLYDDTTLNLYEVKRGDKAKIQYIYNVGKNCFLNIDKFNYSINTKEMILSNLNDVGANISYNFKSISKTKCNYDLVINHNSSNTISNIKNNTVNIEEGKVSFQVSSYVDKGYKECIVNQSNRIINLTNNKCEIRPNLYINEFDTIANHSALIGTFSKDELFYLQSRGINLEEANKLLINGFLLSDFENKEMVKEVKNIVNEYWR